MSLGDTLNFDMNICIIYEIFNYKNTSVASEVDSSLATAKYHNIQYNLHLIFRFSLKV